MTRIYVLAYLSLILGWYFGPNWCLLSKWSSLFRGADWLTLTYGSCIHSWKGKTTHTLCDIVVFICKSCCVAKHIGSFHWLLLIKWLSNRKLYVRIGKNQNVQKGYSVETVRLSYFFCAKRGCQGKIGFNVIGVCCSLGLICNRVHFSVRWKIMVGFFSESTTPGHIIGVSAFNSAVSPTRLQQGYVLET